MPIQPSMGQGLPPLILTKPAATAAMEFVQAATPPLRNTSSCLEDELLQYTCSFDASPSSTAVLVLKFNKAGRAIFQEMDRSDLLRITREAASAFQEKISDEAARGEKPRTNTWPTQMSSYCDIQPVQMRDLRKLDSAFAASNESWIMVRQQAVLFNADPVRAIILRDSCVVFVPDGADSILSLLTRKFQDFVQSKDTDSPYEFRALEAILSSLCSLFADQYDQNAASILDTLDEVAQVRVMSGELETLRVMKTLINEFETHVASLRSALMEILENEEDLRLLYLSKLHDDPLLVFDLGRFDSEQVEILLESYLKDIHSTRTRATLLQHRIQTTESLVMMKLDYARNYLLALELLMSLVMTAIGLGTMVTGIFGMNLPIESEKTTSPAAFFWVASSVIVTSVLLIWGGIWFFRRKGLMIVG